MTTLYITKTLMNRIHQTGNTYTELRTQRLHETEADLRAQTPQETHTEDKYG